ncbi:hypothetical protein, variant 1 [Aphanomyces astaci]|uniref:PH domain-containing protein n=1 Tax=Aphanomyces astaci TaxID=112090 RepID=W4GZR5_APHAT|nr:hypothetical protein, variant 1 [Aphanomyces astaci]ETV85225.1 hypothetical protein, variant 1 [Aphanomyces astaci]|eukprot:XP_009825243.1 hypothetical protein, variant 1 [Aphanomyces astaci]
MPTPHVYHGVDITPLEGWMTKYKSKGKFFGTSNKRWFKVNVTAVNNASETQRLTLSYFKSKKATDVRGWIYLEDVTEIINKSDAIEIVSPTRTLRLKGETAAEHRMWLDSLRQLCFPEPASPPQDSAKQADRHATSKPHLEHTDSQSKASSNALAPREASTSVPYVPVKNDPPPEAKTAPSEAKSHAKQSPPHHDASSTTVANEPPLATKQLDSSSPPPPRAETKTVTKNVAEAKPALKPRGSVLDLKPRDESQNALEFSDSDASDDDDNEDEYGGDAKTSHAATDQEQPSASDSTNYHRGSTPNDETSPPPRAVSETNNKRSVESFSNSNNSSVDEAKQLDDGDTEVERFEPSPARPAPKQPVSDYFDDDADEFPKKPTAAVSSSPPKLAPSSSTESKAAPAPHAGVASDANFVTEDWD